MPRKKAPPEPGWYPEMPSELVPSVPALTPEEAWRALAESQREFIALQLKAYAEVQGQLADERERARLSGVHSSFAVPATPSALPTLQELIEQAEAEKAKRSPQDGVLKTLNGGMD